MIEYTNKGYDSVIFLIRNPFDAVIAEANRVWTKNNHTDFADSSEFKNYPKWSTFVAAHSYNWGYTAKLWLQRDKPIIVVK